MDDNISFIGKETTKTIIEDFSSEQKWQTITNDNSDCSSCMTNSTESNLGVKYLMSPNLQIIITICYIVGIFGNSLALIFLCKKSTRPNNQRHRMMLKCLSINDLTAMLGMMVLMYIQLYLPVAPSIWFCRARVIWRVFGLGSGCVTLVMAVERWLALTKPFFYQKVSYLYNLTLPYK